MKVARLFMSGIALALVATACEKSTEPEDALTKEEAEALFKSRLSMRSLLADSTNKIHESVDSSVYRCPGGEVKIVVKEFAFVPVPGDSTKTRLLFRAESLPRGCTVTGGDMEFTVDGDPSLNESLDMTLAFLVPEVGTGSVSGGLKWALGDRSGSCEVDVALRIKPDDSDPDNPKLTHTYKGSMCGHEVEIVELVDIVDLE